MRRSLVQAALLALLVAVTLPPLVVLCRGRSPSRFSPVNLPVWERKAPQPAHAKGLLQAVPLPPNAVQWDKPLVQATLQSDENRLLSQMESPPPHPTVAAGNAGAWLESACALGRQPQALAAKQDRVALRLMTAEDADGYLAAGQKRGRWTASQVVAESRNLRGLLACYAVTHHAPVIYAAMQAGDLVVSAPELAAMVPRTHVLPLGNALAHKAFLPPTAPLVLPLVRLFVMTGQVRYMQWALQQARAGRVDAPGLCALFVATGQAAFLHQAQEVWKQSAAQGTPDLDAASCLLAATGGWGYVRVVRSGPAPWACPLAAGSLAFAQTPHGLAINAWTNARFGWHGGQWAQRTAKVAGGLMQMTLTVSARQPVKATLSFPTAGAAVTADVNHVPFTAGQGPGVVTIARVWRGGDRLTLTALPVPARLPTSPRGQSVKPLPLARPKRR